MKNFVFAMRVCMCAAWINRQRFGSSSALWNASYARGTASHLGHPFLHRQRHDCAVAFVFSLGSDVSYVDPIPSRHARICELKASVQPPHTHRRLPQKLTSCLHTCFYHVCSVLGLQRKYTFIYDIIKLSLSIHYIRMDKM